MDIVVVEIDAPPPFPVGEASLGDIEGFSSGFKGLFYPNFVGKQSLSLSLETIELVVKFALYKGNKIVS